MAAFSSGLDWRSLVNKSVSSVHTRRFIPVRPRAACAIVAVLADPPPAAGTLEKKQGGWGQPTQRTAHGLGGDDAVQQCMSLLELADRHCE